MPHNKQIDIESLQDYLKTLLDDPLINFSSGHDVITWLSEEYDLDLTIEEVELDEDETEFTSESDTE